MKRLVIILKILLLFLLSFNHSYAADVLAEITARLVKTPITQGEFSTRKTPEDFTQAVTVHGVIYLSSKQRGYLENADADSVLTVG